MRTFENQLSLSLYFGQMIKFHVTVEINACEISNYIEKIHASISITNVAKK